jgi:hypothetical protein
MDYEAEDRFMSSWVVSCVKGTVRFYLTEAGLATDILGHARVYRWEDEAKGECLYQRDENWGAGFNWQPRRTAQDSAERGA